MGPLAKSRLAIGGHLQPSLLIAGFTYEGHTGRIGLQFSQPFTYLLYLVLCGVP
jgi:hypothetical protein